jgi:flagella basal body P-ring formation protein FlgA
LPNRLVPGNQNIFFETATSNGASTLVAWPVTITLHQSVAIARRPIPANTIITAEDVQDINRPISDPHIRPVSAEEIIGRSVNREIHALEMVVSQSLASAQPIQQQAAKKTVIRAGSQVTVVLRKGRLELTMPSARALQSGSGGDVIEVENLSTHKRLVCRVIDERTVELVH